MKHKTTATPPSVTSWADQVRGWWNRQGRAVREAFYAFAGGAALAIAGVLLIAHAAGRV